MPPSNLSTQKCGERRKGGPVVKRGAAKNGPKYSNDGHWIFLTTLDGVQFVWEGAGSCWSVNSGIKKVAHWIIEL